MEPSPGLAVVVAILVAGGLYFALFIGLEGSESAEDPPLLDARIHTDRIIGRVGTDFNLDGTGSEGEVGSYSWNLGDGSEKDGSTVVHTYDDVGRYQVSLTVGSAGGKNDTDYIYLHVNHQEWHNGSIDRDQRDSYDFDVFYHKVGNVDRKAGGIVVELRYPAQSGDGLDNHLNLSVRGPEDAYKDDPAEEREGDTIVAVIEFFDQEILLREGTWTASVDYDTGGVINSEIDYSIDILVEY